MKFSTKTRYGIRAMLEIARNDPDGVFQKDIAEAQHISVKYLDQIVYALKAAGLIANVRGKKSGYVLTRKPADINMLDIHNAFEHGICIIDCMSETYLCEMKDNCMTRGFWGKLNFMIKDYFEKKSLQDLIDEKDPLEC